MPFTVAHPAAVIPFRSICPARLSWSALIVGAVSPDLDYLLSLSSRSGPGHTFAGTLYFCVPLGLIVLWVFHGIVKRPTTLLLPRGDRERLWRPARDRFRFTGRSLLVVSVSLLLGAWTHLAWDAFTHAGTWGPRHLPFLNAVVFSIDAYHVTVFRAIQHGSTVVGIILLCWTYARWRNRAKPQFLDCPKIQPGWRAVLIAVLLFVPLLAAGLFAGAATPPIRDFMTFREWVGHFVVSALSFGGLTIVIVSGLIGILEGRLTEKRT